HTMRSCYKGEPMKPPQIARPGCAPAQYSRTASGGYSISTSCAMPNGGSVQFHALYIGDFSTRYAANTEVRINVAGHTMVRRGRIEGRWVGPC
ncbi:MAG: DUF3617 domain-containing protein, partial [Caulobacteraceae bacterium]